MTEREPTNKDKDKDTDTDTDTELDWVPKIDGESDKERKAQKERKWFFSLYAYNSSSSDAPPFGGAP